MLSTIERAMRKLEFNIQIDSNKFLIMNNNDRELLINSLSEKEKYDNLRMFRTLPVNKIEWVDHNDK